MSVSESDIEEFTSVVSRLFEAKEYIRAVKNNTNDFKIRYQNAAKAVNAFQANLTRISTHICNCENVIDGLTEVLQRTEVPAGLKRQVIDADVDSDQFSELLERISALIQTAKNYQDRGFLVGNEMAKDLDPPVDKAVRKIVSKCSELLTIRKDNADWLDILHEDILDKSKFIRFAEEARPTALNIFFSKYADLAGSFYYANVKGYFSQMRLAPHRPRDVILIGTAVDENGLPLGGITRKLSNLSIFSTTTTPTTTTPRPEPQPDSPTIRPVPVDFSRLLLQLFAEEFRFYKTLLESGHVKRKSSLIKAFSKPFAYGKSRLKEFMAGISPTGALQLMAELNALEVETSDAYDISTPSQWLGEIQTIVFDHFKDQVRKQIESLNSFPELKTTLSSSELHHHYVSKRFAQLMLSCLQTLSSLPRPMDLALVELKKLEQAYFSWTAKVATYLRDKKEASIFLLNNIDLVSRTCDEVAGADFNASLKFKFNAQMERLVQLELEAVFSDVIAILSGLNDGVSINDVNASLSTTLKQRINQVKEQSFLHFSNIEVGQGFRRRFSQEALQLYSQYLDYFDRTFGKNAAEQENEILPPDLNQAKAIILLEE